MPPVTCSVIGNPSDNPMLHEIFTRFAQTYGEPTPRTAPVAENSQVQETLIPSEEL